MAIIAQMNLAAIDLNLLVAFEALLEERHVTRAGQRIGLAQPSMSSALSRLRLLFKDDILVRTAGGMRPTAKALALAPAISEALTLLRTTLGPQKGFDAATSRHRFTLAVTDYGDLVVVPALVAALRREAPGVDLTVRPIIDAADALASLERGEIDAMIGGHLPSSPRCLRSRLFEEHFVCVRDGGASPGPIDAAGYLARPHVLFSAVGGDGSAGAVDQVLAARGLRRRVAVTLPHVVAVPFAVAGSDLIATMAARIAGRFAASAGVAIEPVPYPVASFDIDLVLRRDGESEPATAWLSRMIRRVTAAG
ncbi:LysR family transcriptional regulator [Bosea sp. 685]|uniref:LysR family transcriptional regulator n=1 Tax=Bosea sp. 685 TaxID=3080057 RepID=UPI002892F122|nr:LysR substrate-binding domain-containing protein [Bosea sp. 685]WNJ91566.1 LysR substrate-binding domain-containing protein [Bosea sp. 685]